jgi:hypothetical protein
LINGGEKFHFSAKENASFFSSIFTTSHASPIPSFAPAMDACQTERLLDVLEKMNTNLSRIHSKLESIDENFYQPGSGGPKTITKAIMDLTRIDTGLETDMGRIEDQLEEISGALKRRRT